MAERGGQWLLSCFAPFKERPHIPGMEDVSPEEVRWEMYQAQKNGVVEQAVSKLIYWLVTNLEVIIAIYIISFSFEENSFSTTMSGYEGKTWCLKKSFTRNYRYVSE